MKHTHTLAHTYTRLSARLSTSGLIFAKLNLVFWNEQVLALQGAGSGKLQRAWAWGPAAHPRAGPGGERQASGRRNKRGVNWGDLGSWLPVPGPRPAVPVQVPPLKTFCLSLLGPKPTATGSPVES